jgi:hypothetical protein
VTGHRHFAEIREAAKTWHPKMTELHSTTISNSDGSCCYRGCEQHGSVQRITRRGWFLIRYCPAHERTAVDVFGVEQFEAVS